MTIQAFLMGVIPSAGALGLFVFAIRGIVRADRRERAALAEAERQEDQAAAKGGESVA